MKRIILILQIITLSVMIAGAQISYEGKQDADLMVFQLDDGTLQFIKLDSKLNKLLVYNADNALSNTIDLNIPKGHLIDDITLLNIRSSNRYNILYTCFYIDQKPIEDFADQFPDQEYMVNVLDMEGNYIMQIPNTRGYKILSTDNSNKLLVYRTERKGFKTNRFVEIYALGNDK